MITIGDTQYRNLEEQVEKNKNDILYMLEEEGVLNEFGIRVVGDVDASGDLPDPTTYEGEFGDAYAVGTQTPYTLYIFTRANSTHSTNYWFNIGQFPLPGPAGPSGATGPTGPTGLVALEYIGDRTSSTPPIVGAMIGTGAQNFNRTPVIGDCFFQMVRGIVNTSASGRTWFCSCEIMSTSSGLYNYQIRSVSEITGATGPIGNNGPIGPTGPAGPTGPIGPTGAAGSPFVIQGTVSDINQLPNPSTIPDNVAYLVGTAAPYDLYVQVHEDDTWLNVGQVEGVVGPTGPMGPTGATGATGEQGPIGPTGIVGPTGPVGPTGISGIDGAPGAVGPTGPAGPKGATGDQGPVGPVGGIGPVGPTGPRGLVGPTGPAGSSGTNFPNKYYVPCYYGTSTQAVTLFLFIETSQTLAASPSAEEVWNVLVSEGETIIRGTLFDGENSAASQDGVIMGFTVIQGSLRLLIGKISAGTTSATRIIDVKNVPKAAFVSGFDAESFEDISIFTLV